MKEQYPTVKIIHNRRNNATASKAASVEIELSYNRKRKWFSTGVMVTTKNWNDKNRVIGLADAIDLNQQIEAKERAIKNYIRQLMIDGRPFDWSSLNRALENVQLEGSFLKFVENRVSARKDIKDSTRRNHKKLIVALKEFNRIETFSDLTRGNIVKFDDWLRARKVYTQSTVASYHRFLKVYINEAIRQELISHNPYLGFRVDNGKPTTRKFLTPEEFIKIETATMPTPSIERVRDMFLLQCYTGLSYSDMRKFDFEKVQLRGNRYVLHDIRKKTGEDFYIVLLPPAMEILKKYDFRMHMMTNEQYNLRLKIVAEASGLDKRLTSHMGRHTFATMSLNSGIKIEVLAQMMGHADIRTTPIYAKMINCTVEEAYSVLETNEQTKMMINQLNSFLAFLISLLKSA